MRNSHVIGGFMLVISDSVTPWLPNEPNGSQWTAYAPQRTSYAP